MGLAWPLDMAARNAIVLILAMLAAACGGSQRQAQEGPCFAPGEACGAAFCSQAAYCDEVQRCASKLGDGLPCSEAKQCTGARCESGKCAGGPVVCTESGA